MSVSHLSSVEDYTDTVAGVYNSAYGYSLGIATLAGVYEDNCAVTSEASTDRRFAQLTLAFHATVSEAKAVSASTNAASLTPASFAAGISSASSAQGVTMPVQLIKSQESL